MIPSGKLKERIAFERRGEVDDGYGNTQSGEWSEFYQCAARVRPLAGGEQVLGQRLEGKQPVAITIRRCADALAIDTDCQARDVRTGRVYAVTAPPADMAEDRMALDILAVAGVAT